MRLALHSHLFEIAALISLLSTQIASLRWLRVAQREHYIAGSTSRFAVRWWVGSSLRINTIAVVVAVLIGELTARPRLGGVAKLTCVVAPAVIAAIFPKGLGVRGRTAKLSLTSRMKRLMAFNLGADLALLGLGDVSHTGFVVAALLPIAAPVVVDLVLVLSAPLESRGLSRWVHKAERRLRRISPRIVAITGSFGKTTTKNYVGVLVGDTFQTLVSPASFNNRGGLAKTLNEYMNDGTEVFVAEMGTFGPGEIASLCEWIRPDISVLSALGPVHLERFGSEDAILEAKLEITVHSPVVVVCTDYSRLEMAAKRLEAQGKKVWRVSEKDFGANVNVRANDEGEYVVYWEQRRIGSLPQQDVAAGNVACAVAVALELGVPPEVISDRLGELKASPNRLTATVLAESGVEVLDDTYNSNPAGARRALAALDRRRAQGKRATVVTPGMVELGVKQYGENLKFGSAIAEVATYLIVVGATNRKALVEGARRTSSEASNPLVKVIEVRRREHAVEWVRNHLGTNDVVLYENDLPDHFP